MNTQQKKKLLRRACCTSREALLKIILLHSKSLSQGLVVPSHASHIQYLSVGKQRRLPFNSQMFQQWENSVQQWEQRCWFQASKPDKRRLWRSQRFHKLRARSRLSKRFHDCFSPVPTGTAPGPSCVHLGRRRPIFPCP